MLNKNILQSFFAEKQNSELRETQFQVQDMQLQHDPTLPARLSVAGNTKSEEEFSEDPIPHQMAARPLSVPRVSRFEMVNPHVSISMLPPHRLEACAETGTEE